jgi:hypothetical protein
MIHNRSLAGQLAAIDPQRRAQQLSQPLTQLIGRGQPLPRQLVIGAILVLALLAFEVFNFDTTRFALQDLLGDASFATLQWATILAIAFCAIDFAGLIRLFTPDDGQGMPKEVWYLMGAWLLGATMNAMMTWWAVSLTLLNHNLGNEVLSREQLLHIVPIFVAVLVWLTRILFIGALTVASEEIASWRTTQTEKTAVVRAVSHRPSAPAVAYPDFVPVTDEMPSFLSPGRPRTAEEGRFQRPFTTSARDTVAEVVAPPEQRTRPAPAAPQPGMRPVNNAPDTSTESRQPQRSHDRVRQRPPMPGGANRFAFGGAQARGRQR